jgi:hypothetical protein
MLVLIARDVVIPCPGSDREVEQMRRREFITLLGGAAASPVAWPLAARAQGRRVRHVGVLMGTAESDRLGQIRLREFRLELRRLGWIDGDSVRIDERWSADDLSLVRAHAAEMASSNADVILVTAARIVPIMQQATRTIPIVFTAVSDPVGAGFVTSLARPGGNTTGFSGMEYSVVGKLLEALKQIAPDVARVATSSIRTIQVPARTIVHLQRPRRRSAWRRSQHPFIRPPTSNARLRPSRASQMEGCC